MTDKIKLLKNKKIVIPLLLIVVLTLVYIFFPRFEKEKIEDTDEALGIETKEDKKPVIATLKNDKVKEDGKTIKGEIINIALFGLDGRTEDDKGVRSDSIMVATLDTINNEVKITSFMRDQAVPIDGYGTDKLNHAYAFGGPQLMIKTMNQNFGLNIRDFVAVNFYSFERIVDIIGGIEVDLSESERVLINKYANEIASLSGKSYIPLSQGELSNVKLNGAQTVAYSRIRKTGNGDIERGSRQRLVLNKIFEKVKNENVLTLSELWVKVAPEVNTSLTDFEILKYAKTLSGLRNKEIQQNSFPLEGTWKGYRGHKGVWYIGVDLEKQKEAVNEWIFNPSTKDKEMEGE